MHGQHQAPRAACRCACRLHEELGWRYDLAELEATITPRTRAIYINSPHNPTGGVLTRDDVEAIAALCRERNLWLISDEAYEDVLFDGAEHVSPASLPGMYERTISRLHVQQVVRDDRAAARLPRASAMRSCASG